MPFVYFIRLMGLTFDTLSKSEKWHLGIDTQAEYITGPEKPV